MKIIFLDIDGVLNWSGTEDRIDGYIGWCDKRIARFNRIIEAHPDAKIVISSSWRVPTSDMKAYTTFDGLKELLAKRGLKGEIIGRTPYFFSGMSRGGEIRRWIEEQPEKPSAFVVLDDDTYGMAPFVGETFKGYDPLTAEEVWVPTNELDLRPHHVVTDWTGDPDFEGEEGGLQDRHIDLAIRILNGETIS